MVQTDVMPRGVNPKVTEQFLLGISDDVLDASVLWFEGNLHAYVTVSEGVSFTRQEIQAKCLEELGMHQTPRMVTFMRARQRLRAA